MFSEREKEIIKVIGPKKMTIKDIGEKVFVGKTTRPFDADISIGNSLRRIIQKCEYFNLTWTLKREKQGNKLLFNKEKV